MNYEDTTSHYLEAVAAGLYNVELQERAAYKEAHNKGRDTIRVRPSGASIILPITPEYTKLIGKCHRQVFFRFFDVPVTNPTDLIGMRRMDMGKVIEKREHEYADASKQLEVIQHNLRLKTPLIDDIIISAEVDSLMKDTAGQLFVQELKSFYGYQAKKEIFGSRDTTAAPKGDHLLQVMIYLYMMKVQDVAAKYAQLHDISRDDFKEKSFIIELEQENNEAFPLVDGRPFRDYTLTRIISRFTALGMALKNKRLPPRDGEIEYSNRKIETLAELGLLSKNKVTKWQKGEDTPGDFQCSYCNYKHLCYGSHPHTRETWPTDEAIMERINNGSVTPIDFENTKGW